MFTLPTDPLDSFGNKIEKNNTMTLKVRHQNVEMQDFLSGPSGSGVTDA